MTSQLQQVINLTKSLSLSEQLELLNELATIIRETHLEEAKSLPSEDEYFSAERFASSWQQATAGQTIPLSQL